MRRIAWKQCRSCSADSLSMWPDSFARNALARMDALPARLQHRRHRMLGEPVDLEVGMELAQLVGDRGVALRVAEPDRRGDVERALAARLAAHPARGRRRRRDELAQEEVDLDRIADVRAVPRAFEQDELAAGLLGECDPAARTRDRVLRALDHEHRAAEAAAEVARRVLVEHPP